MATCWNCNKEYPEGSSACPHCRVPVTKAALDAMATIGPGGAPSVQIVPGSVVSGRYEVRREIGRGGMGIVYLAFDRTMEQEVALKVIPQELCMDPRAIADLKRETGIALKLTHPHIMRLYTLDTWEGQAFVVMEYVDGGTLAHLLAEKQRLSLDEALPLLQQIASALDYSHTTSPAVIHRDLKPLNILLTDQGQIKVADFGLARVLRDSASRVSGHDSAGTLAYMAPEQIRGKGIARHTDIYALAAITYEMFAGHPPFYTGDLRWQIMHEEAEPLEGLSDQVNSALQLGLAKERNVRPMKAGEFVAMLCPQNVLDDIIPEYGSGFDQKNYSISRPQKTFVKKDNDKETALFSKSEKNVGEQSICSDEGIELFAAVKQEKKIVFSQHGGIELFPLVKPSRENVHIRDGDQEKRNLQLVVDKKEFQAATNREGTRLYSKKIRSFFKVGCFTSVVIIFFIIVLLAFRV